MPGPDFHSRVHRANGTDPIPVLIHRRVFSDQSAVATTGGERFVTITDDLGGTYLRSAHAALTTAGAGALEVQIHNVTQAVDMLSTVITVDTGDTNSYGSATPPVVDTTGTPANNRVLRGDQIRVDVETAAGTGLEVLLEFGPQVIRLT